MQKGCIDGLQLYKTMHSNACAGVIGPTKDILDVSGKVWNGLPERVRAPYAKTSRIEVGT